MKRKDSLESIIKKKLLQLKSLMQKIEDCEQNGYENLADAYRLEVNVIRYEIFHPESITL